MNLVSRDPRVSQALAFFSELKRDINGTPQNAQTQRSVQLAIDLIGFPAIRSGANSDDPLKNGNNLLGFDCSGLFHYVLKSSNANLFVKELQREARFAREFFDHIGCHVHNGNEKPGDLVFFSYDGAMPTHMGMYVGAGLIVHKGFIDLSLITPIKPSGDYNKRVILSTLTRVSNDRRNAGNPIKHIRPDRGPHIYGRNPIGFKRVFYE